MCLQKLYNKVLTTNQLIFHFFLSFWNNDDTDFLKLT